MNPERLQILLDALNRRANELNSLAADIIGGIADANPGTEDAALRTLSANTANLSSSVTTWLGLIVGNLDRYRAAVAKREAAEADEDAARLEPVRAGVRHDDEHADPYLVAAVAAAEGEGMPARLN